MDHVPQLARARPGWTAGLLLGAMLLAVGWATTATEWTQALEIVPLAGLVGLAAGSLLGWSIFGGTFSHAIGTVYGLAWVGNLLAQQLPDGLTGKDRIIVLVGRLAEWIRLAVSGGTSDDALVFVMLLSALSWAIGYNAGWNTYRRLRVWRAVIPAGVAVLVIVYYYVGPAPMMGYLAMFLAFCLLYIARSHLAEEEGTWLRERISYDPGLRLSVLRAGAVVTIVVMSLAWVAPGTAAVPRLLASWRQLSKPMRVIQDEWKRLFSTLYGGPPPRSVEPFGPTLALGGSRSLPDTLVMDVEAPLGTRYYWRGAVYGVYGGDHWETLEQERIQIIPGEQPPDMERFELRHPVTQTFTGYLLGQRTLLGAAQFRVVDRDAEALIDATAEVPLEYVRILSVEPLDAGDQYHVVSEVSTVDKQSLREAGDDYPAWISSRYVQLPSSLPERVRQLAEVVAADADNAYDRTVALERYLRDTITYTLEPPPVPEGRDYVDYLLFESRRDYCNGYASALVVMARSLGIPARLAVGYSQGEYDSERDAFRVRKENAHSWPEVYFPRYGWLEFEPTRSQLPISRPERPPGELSPDDVGSSPWIDEAFPFDLSLLPGAGTGGVGDWAIEPLSAQRTSSVWIMMSLAGLVALAGTGWWALENVGFRGTLPVERAYGRLLRFGRWLGPPPRPSDTPSEWAGAVSAAAPEAREPISRIVELYVRARFARGDAAAPEARAAWARLRPLLLRGSLRRIVRSVLRRRA